MAQLRSHYSQHRDALRRGCSGDSAHTPGARPDGIHNLHGFGLQLSLALKNQVIKRRHTNRRLASLFSNKRLDSTSLTWGSHLCGHIPQLIDSEQRSRRLPPFVSFGTTALSWSQHIDVVASKLWPAGCVDPCFNSVTVLAAVCSAGRKDLGPMPCNAAHAGFAAPPRM